VEVVPASGASRSSLAARTALFMGLFVLISTATAVSIAGYTGGSAIKAGSAEAFSRASTFLAAWASERQFAMRRDADLVKSNGVVLNIVHKASLTVLPGLGPTVPPAPPCLSGGQEMPEGSRPWAWENLKEAFLDVSSLNRAALHESTADVAPQRVAWALVSADGRLLSSHFVELRDDHGCEIDYDPTLFPLLAPDAPGDPDCLVAAASAPWVKRSGLFAPLGPNDAYYACAIPIEGDDRSVWAKLVTADALNDSFFEKLRRITDISVAVLDAGGHVIAAGANFQPSAFAASLRPGEQREAMISGSPWILGLMEIERPLGGRFDRFVLGKNLSKDQATLHRTLGIISLGGLAAGLLGIGLAIAYVRRGWIRRLGVIAQAVENIARRSQNPDETEWPPRLKPKETDEIGDLGKRLDAMVDGLEVYEQALRRFSSQEIVQLLRTNASSLASRRSELTVLFTDIANFTHLSEGREPEEVNALLDDYLATMTNIAIKHGAFIDKFIGDAIMAIWGAPGTTPGHAALACEGAMAMRDAAHALEKSYAERGWPGLKTRFGLNTGKMMVGLIGPEDRKAYTVLGDEVNLASRLEGVNKVYGTEILVSGAVYLAAKEGVSAREIDRVRVKGKDVAVTLYELLAKGAVPEPKRDAVRAYASALELYRQRQFAEAEEEFEKADAAMPGGDPPARVMALRCIEYLSKSPSGDWDGSFTLDTK
jgi:class 3 adenylate cyclase